MRATEYQHTRRAEFVSLIVPIRNEAGFIARTMDAILQQDYPHEQMEILVAVGESTDGTPEIAAEIAAQTNIPITIIRNPSGIVPTGFNLALRKSRGNIIVRVDGHTLIAGDYVRQCVAALQRTGAENVGGRMDPIGTNAFGKAVALATSSPFGVGGSRFHYSTGEEWVDTVYLGAWRRDVFDRIGGFDEEQVRNQDDEFNYRIASRGGRILLTPAIKSVYYTRSTAKLLWRQYYQYGYWKVRVVQKHPRQAKARHFVPAGFVLALSLLAGASIFSTAARGAGITVAGLYVVCNLAATVSASKGNRRAFPLIAAAFAVIHIAYGAGFLMGLIRFWNRWRQPAAESQVNRIQPELR